MAQLLAALAALFPSSGSAAGVGAAGSAGATGGAGAAGAGAAGTAGTGSSLFPTSAAGWAQLADAMGPLLAGNPPIPQANFERPQPQGNLFQQALPQAIPALLGGGRISPHLQRLLDMASRRRGSYGF